MATVTIILLAAVLVLLALLLFQTRTRQLESQNQSLVRQTDLFNQTQRLITDQLTSILTSINQNLSKTQGHITTQLHQTGTVVHEIQKKLGALEETTREIREIGQDISSLQDILQAPKLRGNLGEYLLEDLLRQIFPAKNYQMKYSFKNGTQVDAVIRLGEGVIPVDAKFPLESFQRLVAAKSDEDRKKFKKEFIRSVKERIDEIAGKYIRPDEGTFDFAMLYIPAENVFYETIINDTLTDKSYELFNYAIQKYVIPVSPNSFYAYLMAIVFGLKGFHIEQQAKVIISELSRVQESFARFGTDFSLLGRHLGNAMGKYDECAKKADGFQDKLQRVIGGRREIGSGADASDAGQADS